MTQAEWLAATDPAKMLEFLWTSPGNRKLRLFGSACCRLVWDRLTFIESRNAVEAVEQFADGEIDSDQLTAARTLHRSADTWRTQRNAANAVSEASIIAGRGTVALEAAIGAAKYAAHALTDKPDGGATSYRDASWRPRWDAARRTEAGLVQDIFGNPFRPVRTEPAWLTSTVVSLAEGIYGERAFDRMPILADALQDAGCDHADILQHCRGEGPHVRGCWVVDLLLGKE